MKQLSFLLLIIVFILQAEVQSIPKKSANARFITAVSPEIDGALDEQVWQDVQIIMEALKRVS